MQDDTNINPVPSHANDGTPVKTGPSGLGLGPLTTCGHNSAHPHLSPAQLTIARALEDAKGEHGAQPAASHTTQFALDASAAGSKIQAADQASGIMSGSSSASTSGASDQGFVEQHSTVLGIVNDIVNALDNDQTDHPFLATASSEPLTDPIGALGDYLEHSGLPREFVDQIGPLSVKYVLAYTLRLQRLVAARAMISRLPTFRHGCITTRLRSKLLHLKRSRTWPFLNPPLTFQIW